MLVKYIAHLKNGHVEGFVEGDDGIFACDFELTARDYEKLGFTIKIEEVDDPRAASFCGMIFSDSGEIIRDPRRFIEKFGWTLSFVSAGDKIMDELLRAKALSTVYETPQCPIVGVFAREALKHTSHVHPRFVRDGYSLPLPDVINIPDFNPSISTRELFESVYHVSIAEQLLMEEAVRKGDLNLVSSIMTPHSDIEDYAGKYVVPT
jgi:hypothetical protein